MVKIGDSITTSRHFTFEEVQEFAELTGDRCDSTELAAAPVARGPRGRARKPYPTDSPFFCLACRNPWHMVKDKRGRVVVHGLLVASLLTRIASETHYMARTFE